MWGDGLPVPGPIAASTDGGTTWTSQRAESTELREVRFDRTGSGYAFGDGTLHYRNTEIAAYRAVRPPQLDGDLSDWSGVPSYGLKAAEAIRVNGVLPAPLDGSAVLQAAWDAATCTSPYASTTRRSPWIAACSPGRTTRSSSAWTATMTTAATGARPMTASSR